MFEFFVWLVVVVGFLLLVIKIFMNLEKKDDAGRQDTCFVWEGNAGIWFCSSQRGFSLDLSSSRGKGRQ